MENKEKLSREELNSVILDGQDIIEMAGNEVIINDAEESQKRAFALNLEEYKNTLTSCNQEKAMITLELYNKIMSALRCGKGGKKVGIDSKFYSWCKTHFKIINNAGTDTLCSVKSHTRVAVVENYFPVWSESMTLIFHHLHKRFRF